MTAQPYEAIRVQDVPRESLEAVLNDALIRNHHIVNVIPAQDIACVTVITHVPGLPYQASLHQIANTPQ